MNITSGYRRLGTHVQSPHRRRVPAVLIFSFVVWLSSFSGSWYHAVRIPPVAIIAHQQRLLSLAISGSMVVWAVSRGNLHDRIPHHTLLGKNIMRDEKEVVIASETASGSVAMSGPVVVWTDCRRCTMAAGLPGYRNTEIYGRNLITGQEFLVSGTGDNPSTLSISASLVVWADHGNVYSKNLASKRLSLVSPHAGPQEDPVVSNHIVIWQEMRAGAWDIYGKDLRSGRVFLVAQHTRQSSLETPMISAHQVIWSDWRADQSVAIDGKDIATGVLYHVATLPKWSYNPQLGPEKAMSGRIVVWEGGTQRWPNGTHIMYAEDLLSGSRFPIVTGVRDPLMLAISGNRVVWSQTIGSTSTIYETIVAIATRHG